MPKKEVINVFIGNSLQKVITLPTLVQELFLYEVLKQISENRYLSWKAVQKIRSTLRSTAWNYEEKSYYSYPGREEPNKLEVEIDEEAKFVNLWLQKQWYPVRSKFIMPNGQVDREKAALELSDEEFAKFYLECMSTYKDLDGCWQEKNGPQGPHSCAECRETISDIKNLRRMYGLSLHPNCFIEHYNKHKSTESEHSRRYWDRVANVVIN